MRQILLGLTLVAALAACGGDDGGPTEPGPSTTAVSITLRDVVLVGTTAQATATATMSNGQTQAVTNGFRSDATGVATVTDAGLVTGVANGEATIIATSSGRDGTKRIRVAPNYAGQWQGMQLVTACTATGDFAGICEEEFDDVGQSFPIRLVARQTDLSISGEFIVDLLQYPTFTTQVEGDGSISFSSTTVFDAEIVGIRGDTSWRMNSTQDGRASGTIRETYTVPNVFNGAVVYDSTFSDLGRIAAATSPSPSDGAKAIKRWIRLHRR